MHHIIVLQQHHLKLLLVSMIQGYLATLPNNITLMGAQNLDKIELVDLVISKWLC